jgi:hypothetical protein
VEVEGIGQLLGYGEFWKLRYDQCGHETTFARDYSVGYDETRWIIRAIRQYHATCWECAHPQPEPEPPPALHPVTIEGVFPDLVRFRLPSWSEDVPLYVERKTLPPEVDAHLLDAGYRFAVDADLDALTPEQLVASFRNWRAERSR